VIRQGVRDLFWMSGGAILLIAVTLLALHNHREQGIVARIAVQAGRLELVDQMRAALSSATEAEKSAVMATTDQESRTFADQSRAASAVVEQKRDELARLLETDGTGRERDLLSQFSTALSECQRIDHELLDLSVQNTNLKALSLDFGPAQEALTTMDQALARILREAAASTAPRAGEVMLSAAGAQSAAWRLQALLPPHIAQESDARMDSLEARMAGEDRTVHTDLKRLAALLGPERSDLGATIAGYDRFTELKGQIIALSRQNTNVRSLMTSLNQKRKAVQVCQDALTSLEQTIEGEGLANRWPENPR
jgi:hypothetical protein